MLSWVTEDGVRAAFAKNHLKNRLCFISSYTHHYHPTYHWACPINSILGSDNRYSEQTGHFDGNWIKRENLLWRSNLNYLIL